MRLASKQFAEISCRYLMRSVAVSLTSQSFSRLEEVCRHAIFSKSVKKVTIDVSFYDVQLANDRRKFLSDCSARFNYALEMGDFSNGCALVHGRYTEAHKSRSKEAYAIGQQLEELANSNEVTTVFTEPQQRFMDQYNTYVGRTNDQELLRADNNHIKRLCACLNQLPALEEIQLVRSSVYEAGSQCEDLEQYISEGGESVKETPSALYSLALDKQCWNGTSGTADSLEPPIEMMGELLSQLGRANIRPLTIRLELDVPADLTRVQPNQTQCDGIQQLLSRCSTIDIDFHGWKPEDKWGDHERTRQEMVALGSMMKALTSTPALRMLRVHFQSYPVREQFSTINLSDLLPIGSVSWPSLETLEFDHLPFDIDDIRTLVDTTKHSLKSFKAHGFYLRDGSWAHVLDILRECSKLEGVDINYPYGQEYIEGWRGDVHLFPRAEALEYVMGLREVNPLSVTCL